MKCAKIRKQFFDLLGGEITAINARKVDAHLNSCADCRKELEILKKTWKALGEWEEVRPSYGFKSVFWNKVVEKEASLSRFPGINALRRHLVPVLVSLGVALLVIATPRILQNNDIGFIVSKSGKQEENADLIENIELLELLEFLDDFDLMQDLDVIEEMVSSEG